MSAMTSSIGVLGSTNSGPNPDEPGPVPAMRADPLCRRASSALSPAAQRPREPCTAAILTSGISTGRDAAESRRHTGQNRQPASCGRTSSGDDYRFLQARMRAQCASISPSSIRNPRILTCSSTRPINSIHISPHPPQVTSFIPARRDFTVRGPIRGSVQGILYKFSAVNSGRFKYPRATPIPPRTIPRFDPSRLVSNGPSRIAVSTFGSGRPMGKVLSSNLAACIVR